MVMARKSPGRTTANPDASDKTRGDAHPRAPRDPAFPSGDEGRALTRANSLATPAATVDGAALAERVVFRLWSDGMISGRAIEQARQEVGPRRRLDQVLVQLGLAKPSDVATVLADELGAPLATAADFPDEPVLIETLQRRFVSEALAAPIADDGVTLRLAMADPLDDFALRAIQMRTKRQLDVTVACPDVLRTEIDRLYPIAPAVPDLEQRRVAPPRKPLAPKPVPEIVDPNAIAPTWTEAAEAKRAAALAPTPPAPQQRRRFSEIDATAARPAREKRSKPAAAPKSRDHPIAPRPPAPETEARPRRAAAPDERRRSQGARAQGAAKRSEPPAAQPSKAASMPAAARRSEPPAARAPTGAPAPKRDQARLDRAAAPRSETTAPDPRAPRFVRPKRVTRKNLVDQYVDQFEESRPRVAPKPAPPVRRRLTEETIEARHGFVQPVRREPINGAPPLEKPAFMRAVAAVRQPRLEAQARLFDLVDEATREEARARAAETGQISSAEWRRTRDRLRQAEKRRAILIEIRRNLKPRSGTAIAPTTTVIQSDGAPDKVIIHPPSPRLSRKRAEIASSTAEGDPDAGAARRETFGEAGLPVTRHVLIDATAQRALDRRDDGASLLARLEQMHFGAEIRVSLDAALDSEDGLIIVTGPSGSGKRETVRLLCDALRSRGRPVHRLATLAGDDGGEQEAHAAYSGDLRDAASAEIAARAAITGSLVVATLDAPSAPSAPPRLTNMGVPTYVLASCLRIVVAQHLAPRTCTACDGRGRTEDGVACVVCDGAGHLGHLAIVEAMTPDDAVSALILAHAPEAALRAAMAAAGARSLADDAMAKVADGLLTPEDAVKAASAAGVD